MFRKPKPEGLTEAQKNFKRGFQKVVDQVGYDPHNDPAIQRYR